MEALLRTGGKVIYNQKKAFNWLKNELINKI